MVLHKNNEVILVKDFVLEKNPEVILLKDFYKAIKNNSLENISTILFKVSKIHALLYECPIFQLVCTKSAFQKSLVLIIHSLS